MIRTKSKVFIALLLVLIACFATGQEYEIRQYNTTLTLKKDGWMDVEERIVAYFYVAKRGIFRFIPVAYDNGKGLVRTITLKDVRVTDENGVQQETLLTREGENLKIRVGNKDVFLPPFTEKEYVFRYSVHGMLNWFDKKSDWDPYVELYWNLTGDQWDTQIRQILFKVKFPDSIDPKQLRSRVFYGSYGSKANDTLVGEQILKDSKITGFSLKQTPTELLGIRNQATEPATGVTVVLNMPASTIPKPTLFENALMIVMSNTPFLVVFFALGAMMFFWIRFGRDPAGGPRVTQFEPPDGLTPSECGVLVDEKIDTRDISAAFINLAQAGYIEFFVEEAGFFRTKTITIVVNEEQPRRAVGAFETSILRQLQACGPKVLVSELREHLAPNMPSFKERLYESLVSHGYYLSNPQTVRLFWIIGGFIVCALGIFAASRLSYMTTELSIIISGILCAIIVIWFGWHMPKRTKRGSIARMKVLGFAEFIQRARSSEIEASVKRNLDQSLFEEYLPYAVAFGVADEWARAFKDAEIVNPSWYHSPAGTHFNVMYFCNDLQSTVNSSVYAAMTPPRSSGASGGSSGFGGGGFSGGGFGGGGGGSW